MKNMYTGHQYFSDKTLMSHDAFISPGRLVMSNGGHLLETHPRDLKEFSLMQ